MNFDYGKENIMIDPSLFFDKEILEDVIGFIEKNSDFFNFFIPSYFLKMIPEYLEDIRDFYGLNENFTEDDFRFLRDIISKRVRVFEIDDEFRSIYFENESSQYYLYSNLREKYSNHPYLINMIMEEWIFLQEFSKIISKTKHIFSEFKKNGVIAIELTKEALKRSGNWLARKTLKKKANEQLTRNEKLRVIAKWICIPVGNLFGIYFGMLADTILLIDP